MEKWAKPFYVSYTRQGTIPHLITPPPNTRLLALEEFLDYKNKTPINEFLNTKDKIITINQDLIRLTEQKFTKNTQKGIGLIKSQTQIIVTPKMLAETINNLKPYLSILSDPCAELYYNTTEQVYTRKSDNQERKSHERWFNFISQVSKQTQIPLIGCISGSREETIKHTTIELVKSGLELKGYGLILPTPIYLLSSYQPQSNSHFEQSWNLNFKSFIENIPGDKLNLVFGIGSFKYILAAIQKNISVFDNSMVDIITSQGFAFFVDLDLLEGFGQLRNEAVLDLNKLVSTPENVKVSEWQVDLSPLSSTCECFTCKNHTRAYVHHLVCVNDMLASVLLKEHNLYQFDKFFRDVRMAIKDNTFDEKVKRYKGY
jgi:tRNA-guanine family transglycosylase